MTQVNENDNATADQVRRGPGDRAQDFGEQARSQTTGRAADQRPGARALRNAASRLGGAGAAFGHDAGRAGRPEESATAVDTEGDPSPREARTRHAGPARPRPPPGSTDGHRARQSSGARVAPAQRSVAGAKTARSESPGARDSAVGGTDPGEAQPVVTGAVLAGGNDAAGGAQGDAAPASAAGTAAPAGAATKPRFGTKTFGSLRTRNYRLFATGQVVSNTGSWMQRVAQDWLVLQLTHDSGTALGITTGLQFLPLLLFSLWGGVIADRYSKRGVLMVTQSVMGALALVLGVLAITGVVRPWHIYLLAFGLGLATVVDNPTRQSFAIEMVGRDDLRNAIALNSAVFNLARITGPAAAGLVISFIGTPAAFFVNAASYGAVLISLRMMRPAELRRAERVERAKGQLREGLAYVK